jgi:hypothetical protein
MATRPPLTVRIDDTGEVVTEHRGTIHRWVEVSPWVFRRVDGEDTLVFRESTDGTFHFFRASASLDAFESVPWYGQTDVHGQLALGAGLVTLSGAVGWPLAALWRYYRGGSGTPETVMRSRWAAGASMLAFIVFLAIGLFGISQYWLYARPSWFELLFALPIVGAILSLGAAVFVVQSWRQDQGRSLLGSIPRLSSWDYSFSRECAGTGISCISHSDKTVHLPDSTWAQRHYLPRNHNEDRVIGHYWVRCSFPQAS